MHDLEPSKASNTSKASKGAPTIVSRPSFLERDESNSAERLGKRAQVTVPLELLIFTQSQQQKGPETKCHEVDGRLFCRVVLTSESPHGRHMHQGVILY